MKLFIWIGIDPNNSHPSEAVAFANNKKEAIELVLNSEFPLGKDSEEQKKSLSKLLRSTTPKILTKPFGMFLDYGTFPMAMIR